MGLSFHPAARWLIGSTTAAICLAGGGPLSAQAPVDSFVQQRDAEAAVHPSGGFSIAFPDDRRVFRPGETITIVFTFRKGDVSPFNYEHCHGLGLADVVLDHTEGTRDPQADLWNNGIARLACGILSGAVGGVAGSTPREEFPVYLNQAVRFDSPRQYRLYVRSRHRIFHVPGDALPPLISNILEFEIAPRDREWEETTLAGAIDALDLPGSDTTRALAARTISYLGSKAAADEMARRFDRTPPAQNDATGGDWDFHWLRGLYGSPERAHVVAQMTSELDRAGRRISPRFVSHLALLDLTRHSDARPIERSAYDATLRAHATGRLAALKAAGRLRQELATAFAYAAEHYRPIGSLTLVPGFASFPADVEAAFATLPRRSQVAFLTTKRNWTALRDRAFIPMLRRLAAGNADSGPQDIALRLLYDLAPAEARRIALRELSRPDSAVGISGLALLPDRQLPDLDTTFITALENARTSADYGRTMDRIERFGTARIVARVQRMYEQFEDSRTCALAPAALAYFFRVAPSYAQAEIGKVMRVVYEGEPCEAGVLRTVAARRMLAALEDVAIAHLADSNGWVVADAAAMLRQHGSARAEAALWQALERRHDRWKDHRSTLEKHREDGDGIPWEEAIERDLTNALMGGTAWLMSAASQRRLATLCVTRNCRVSVETGFAHAASPSVNAYPSSLPTGEPHFAVQHRTFAGLPSREALYRWFSLHPRGTTFTWQDDGWFDGDEVWLPGEADRLFQEARSFVGRRGGNLIRRN